jgi:hypothetical protein
MKIEELKNYTIPYCGNKRIQPYGDLVISDGESRKTRYECLYTETRIMQIKLTNL